MEDIKELARDAVKNGFVILKYFKFNDKTQSSNVYVLFTKMNRQKFEIFCRENKELDVSEFAHKIMHLEKDAFVLLGCFPENFQESKSIVQAQLEVNQLYLDLSKTENCFVIPKDTKVASGKWYLPE